MSKFTKCLLVILGASMALASHGSRISMRMNAFYPEFKVGSGKLNQFSTLRSHVDFAYALDEKASLNADFTLPEYYLKQPVGKLNTNPHTSGLISDILLYGGDKGNSLYGLKICREPVAGLPAGPFVEDGRLMDESDVAAIRKLITDAKNLGILGRDNFKLFHMVTNPRFFSTNPRAQKLIKSLDGVCLEVHHFNKYYPLNGGIVKPADVATGANWTLSNKNNRNQPLEYIFYYGPFLSSGCMEYREGEEDMFRQYLKGYWAAGFPKSHPRLIYSINAFNHVKCSEDRPGLPEDNPYSIAGCVKWLIGKVKNVNPQGSVRYITKRNARSFAINAGNGAKNDQNVFISKLNPANQNQQWHEIHRGNGFFSYKKRNTNHCLDAGAGAKDNQNVKLWNQNPTNPNQQFKKIHMGGGFHRLEKRATGHSIDGGVGGKNFQNVKIWSNMNNNWNQQWLVE